MNKNDLILNLVRYRFTQNAKRLGMSAGEAAMLSETRMKNEGLFGLLGRVKVMATPEASIVSIVEAFLDNYVALINSDPGFKDPNLEHGALTELRRFYQEAAIDRVESIRARVYPGQKFYPKELEPYILYRMEIEISSAHQIDPASMGFDESTIDFMADQAGQFFKARLKSPKR